MKVAVIGDTHAGIRNDSLVFDSYFKRFFTDIFFPTLKERNISKVFHLGDFFDRRKFVNFQILSNACSYYCNELVSQNIESFQIIGNHDCPMKHTLDIHSPGLLLSNYEDNIHIFDQPTEVIFPNRKVAFIPWICPSNEKEIMSFIEKTDATIAFAHLELVGYSFDKTRVADHGMDPSIFKKFERVYSGHYHTKSEKNNILYCGAPYEFTWIDCDDPKGFHILDLETLDIEYIQNPYKIYHSITYNEDTQIDFSQFKDTYVKVIVPEGSDIKKVDKFQDKLSKEGTPLDGTIKMIYPSDNITTDISAFTNDNPDLDFGDTFQVSSAYIDSLDNLNVDKKNLKDKFEYYYKLGLEFQSDNF